MLEHTTMQAPAHSQASPLGLTCFLHVSTCSLAEQGYSPHSRNFSGACQGMKRQSSLQGRQLVLLVPNRVMIQA